MEWKHEFFIEVLRFQASRYHQKEQWVEAAEESGEEGLNHVRDSKA